MSVMLVPFPFSSNAFDCSDAVPLIVTASPPPGDAVKVFGSPIACKKFTPPAGPSDVMSMTRTRSQSVR